MNISAIRAKVAEETRAIFDFIWKTYLDTSKWPLRRAVSTHFGGMERLRQLLVGLDGSYIFEDGQGHVPHIELRIFGVLCTTDGPKHIELLKGYLGFLRDLNLNHPSAEQTKYDEVAKFLALSPGDSALLGRIVHFLSCRGLLLANSGWAGSPEKWQFGIPDRVDEIPETDLDSFLDRILSDFADPKTMIWKADRHTPNTLTVLSDLEFESPLPILSANRFDRWYQVFVSSTFVDLKIEREHVAQALLLTRGIPSGMEFFPASGRPPWDIIKREIDEADYYLLIVAGRYGSIVPGTSTSYTEREFDYAIEKRKPVIAFCHRNVVDLPADKREDSESQLLEVFRRKVESGRTCKYWTTASELESHVKTALLNAIVKDPQPGWVRGDHAMYNGPPELAAKTGPLYDRLDHLDRQTRHGAERILEIIWNAVDQRVPNSEISKRLDLSEDTARLFRDKLFESSLANRHDNLEKPEDPWIVLTPEGREYTKTKGIQHRIRTEKQFGLSWNDRREPVCADCVVPLSFFDERSLTCDRCNMRFNPNDNGAALNVRKTLELYRGQIKD